MNFKATLQLNTQSDAVIYFISELDIDMLADLLDDIMYQSLKKLNFIEKLNIAFDKLITQGNSYLTISSDPCSKNKCIENCQCYTFYGNKSNHFLQLIIKSFEGRVEDIYECNYYKNFSQKKSNCSQIVVGIDYFTDGPF